MDPDSRVAAPLTPDPGVLIPAGPLPLLRTPVPMSRAKLTFEEKEKVRQVRRQGACLRCRILKIQCSLDNPCQPCLQSAVRGFERKVLSFCYCVRTRFADVNIFDTTTTTSSSSTGAGSINTMQIETLMRHMAGLLARIATPANFDLTSDDPQAFNRTMLAWLTDPSYHLPNGSIVGLCCSSLLGLQFQENEPGTAAADGLVEDFKRFLLATSLVHAGWRDKREENVDGDGRVQTRELYAASQISGSRLLKRLDRVLTPQFLARCGREQCQVLFLLVLGTALGVGYATSGEVSKQLQEQRGLSSAAVAGTCSPWEMSSSSSSSSLSPASLLSPEFQRSPTLWLAMKEHLCQMLAHHLIFVGSMLGIKLETAMERRIIETAVARWNKAEEFVWADASYYDMFKDDPKPTTSSRASSVQQNIPTSKPNIEPGMWHQDSMEPPRPRREGKRRSMWVVRPVETGPEHGLVNFHARLRGGMDMETLRAFV
ncbi:hypothetical protein VTJ49DRAFT_3282 [Mycothermus thermophilus]|uniref:Zn(2)-C6 fungal-type domain-containing protein n=1 Tax=Humicola insolens TaxID=85995 RepID=A0ABR3V8Y2_HUMIN